MTSGNLVRAVAAAAGLALAFLAASPRRALAVDGAIQDPDNGHWYAYFSSATPVAWAAAKADAESQGGYLATITAAAEQQWVYANLIAGKPYTWLGASDAASEGTWQWVTGEPWSYSYWSTGQPDSAFGDQDYLVIGGIYGARW